MKLNITETVLRDANQSLCATRIPMSAFRDILPRMNEAGYYSAECWGGATFDACLRYLGEDPWERLREMRRLMPDTKLQMLLRGQNLLGYRHYSDDTVRRFIRASVRNGIDIIRIFDALNDTDNLRTAVDETKRCGAHPSCAVCYTVSPVHDTEYFVETAKKMRDIGAASLCIKDMSGILTPAAAGVLIRALKSGTGLPVFLHSHCTAGMAYMTYLAALEAGVDGLDTAVSAFSGGTSQPATRAVCAAAKEYGRDTGTDDDALGDINDFFTRLRLSMDASGAIDRSVMMTDPRIFRTQIPGGMYSNLIAQMRSCGIADKKDEVMAEVIRVRRDLGWPPLVTPMSQMVGVQAVSNVLTGERYSVLSREVTAYLRGGYGHAPGKIDEALLERSKKEPQLVEDSAGDAFTEEDGLSEEDRLSLCLFPVQAKKFLDAGDGKKEEDKSQKAAPAPVQAAPASPAPVSLSGPADGSDDGFSFDYSRLPDFTFGEERTDSMSVRAELPCTVIRVLTREGATVRSGSPLLVCETMKMENSVLSPCDGVVTRLLALPGHTVGKGELLLCIDPARRRPA